MLEIKPLRFPLHPIHALTSGDENPPLQQTNRTRSTVRRTFPATGIASHVKRSIDSGHSILLFDRFPRRARRRLLPTLELGHSSRFIPRTTPAHRASPIVSQCKQWRTDASGAAMPRVATVIRHARCHE